MTDVFKLPVFPAANIFPMMTDDELTELAEDISTNGLREPLVKAVVDTPETPKHPKTMMLIDGRNRREACKLAGIEPTTRELSGEDPTAYVLSANVHRRNISTGQRAMALAMLQPTGDKGGRGKTSTETLSFRQRAMAVAKIYPEAEPGKRKISLETKQVGISKTNLSLRPHRPPVRPRPGFKIASCDFDFQNRRPRGLAPAAVPWFPAASAIFSLVWRPG